MIGRKKIRTCITLAAIPQPLAEGCSFQMALHAAPQITATTKKNATLSMLRRDRKALCLWIVVRILRTKRSKYSKDENAKIQPMNFLMSCIFDGLSKLHSLLSPRF
jgi:hypothetical protein